ncbi:MAG: heparinase II/III family protein, partial [Victivallales bacterium]|nr:heparinase II/III family protein [Victivallales bacterium]
IKRMGEFIADCWINQNNFTAFADCSAKIMTCNSHLRIYAQRTRSTKMINFCDNCTQSEKVEPWDAVIINLYRLFYSENKNTTQNKRADFVKYYDKKEMIFAKQGDFYIALKGGHNNENHNHNDVGQFVIYYQNEPVIIDIGAETYTRFTFSEHRYLIDSINHKSHNIIEFEGVGQKEGETHKAENFQFTKNADSFKVTMELKGCYPETTGIISYTRDFVFSGKTGITISDSWQTNSEKSIKLFLFSTNKITNGKLGRLNFECNHNYLTQKYPVHDERMRKSWGTMLYKTEIYSTQISNNGNLTIKINI